MTTPNFAYIALLAILNIPIYIGLYKLIFRDFDEFREALIFWIKPDFWSFMWGELIDDWFAEAKLTLFLALCAGAIALEYLALQALL